MSECECDHECDYEPALRRDSFFKRHWMGFLITLAIFIGILIVILKNQYPGGIVDWVVAIVTVIFSAWLAWRSGSKDPHKAKAFSLEKCLDAIGYFLSVAAAVLLMIK